MSLITRSGGGAVLEGAEGVEEEDAAAERQLEFWPVCTKNGGDCEKKPAVCEVSNATAT